MSSRNIPINDTEIERGRDRASDSSSSRESSPVNKRKRGSTPPSEDDVLVPSTVDIDTPPPSEGPLVREPVAFSSVTANINTYQASLLPVLNSQKYLPGQNPSSAKGKKKRSKRATPFSAQTSRFRVEAYAHNKSETQTEILPLQQGQGPYNSLYRATDDLTASTIGPGAFSESSNSQPQSSAERPSSKRAKLSGPQTDRNLNTTDDFTANLLSMPDPMPDPLQVDAFYTKRPRQSSGESRTWSISSRQSQSTQPGLSSAQGQLNYPPAQMQSNSSATNDGETNKVRRSPPAKRPGFHSRMITILIHDTRSGKIDRQLAEVTIPVRMADDPQDGFWADAKDITEILQSSPSRIDGPARVYTLRGKYRQFFLRVSADNVDNYSSANIGINVDRTLDIVVEKPPELGVMPPSPRVPRELLPSSPEVVNTSESYECEQRKSKVLRKSKKSDHHRYQTALPGGDSSDSESEMHDKQLRRKRPKHGAPKGKGTVTVSGLDHISFFEDRRNSTDFISPYQQNLEQTRGYDSPSTDDDPIRLYETIVRSVEVMIQGQPDGQSYATWRMGRVPELIKAYRFIQRMMDELVGELAPFRTKVHEIRKNHVLAALRIEPKMATECAETVKLLKLYGENGTRCCDSRVVEFIARRDPKPYKQMRLLLHLLRDIHEEWKRNHGAGQSD